MLSRVLLLAVVGGAACGPKAASPQTDEVTLANVSAAADPGPTSAPTSPSPSASADSCAELKVRAQAEQNVARKAALRDALEFCE